RRGRFVGGLVHRQRAHRGDVVSGVGGRVIVRAAGAVAFAGDHAVERGVGQRRAVRDDRTGGVFVLGLAADRGDQRFALGQIDGASGGDQPAIDNRDRATHVDRADRRTDDRVIFQLARQTVGDV